MIQTLGIATWLWCCAWSGATAITHAADMPGFESTIARFGVLPRQAIRPYASLVVATLSLATVCDVIAPMSLGRRAAVAIAFVFATFAVGVILALRRSESHGWSLSCNCMGGILGNDLTSGSWLLPAGVAVGAICAVVGPEPQIFSGYALPAIGLDAVAGLSLIAIVDVIVARSRRKTWIAMMEVGDA